jgi:hypothetical protein
MRWMVNTMPRSLYLFYRTLGGPQCQTARMRIFSLNPPGFDPRTVQPVTSLYTDYAITAHLLIVDLFVSMVLKINSFNFPE